MRKIKIFCSWFGSFQAKWVLKSVLNTFNIFVHNVKMDRTVEEYHKEFWTGLRPFDAALEFLDQLKEQDKVLGIVTNGFKNRQFKKLEHTSLLGFFDTQNIFISENFLPIEKKPSPFMIESFLNMNNKKEKDAVFYGNAGKDILAGNLAQVKTVFFSNCEKNESDFLDIAKPDFIIRTWKELIYQQKIKEISANNF